MTGQVIILRGDAASLPLPDASVDLIVTSPPYFGQRAYTDNGEVFAGQIGGESTPAEYVASLITCTREWMRVLKPQGSLFVNLGDAYYSGKGAPGRTSADPKNAGRTARRTIRSPLDYGLDFPRKTLLNMPHRYAIACTDELGLVQRAEIIWSKPNGMPEKARDRAHRTHEYLFHFTRQPVYFSACDEVREPHAEWTLKAYDYERNGYARRSNGDRVDRGGFAKPPTANPLGKMPGSVWEIAPQPLIVPAWLDVEHFAAMPMELCRRCILGWSPSGICLSCGEGRRPATTAVRTFDGQPCSDLPAWADPAAPRRFPKGAGHGRFGTDRRMAGYACACPDTSAPTRSAVVADPFGGTGTTALVSSALGRVGVTVDRSADYCRLARWRTSDPGERARALRVPKPPPVIDGQRSLFDDVAGGAS